MDFSVIHLSAYERLQRRWKSRLYKKKGGKKPRTDESVDYVLKNTTDYLQSSVAVRAEMVAESSSEVSTSPIWFPPAHDTWHLAQPSRTTRHHIPPLTTTTTYVCVTMFSWNAQCRLCLFWATPMEPDTLCWVTDTCISRRVFGVSFPTYRISLRWFRVK